MPGKRVLVVEDNIDGARTLAALLRQAGHEVEYAINGYAGLEIARKLRPDIVVLDIGLPGIDGYEVCRRLRNEAGLEAIRVVALTAYGTEEHRARSIAAGCQVHLVKPVRVEALLELIEGA
jgi:two-component system, chemotaxis family, CheB/CheR fusion protein